MQCKCALGAGGDGARACACRWLSVRLETLGAMAALAAALLTVEQRGNASTFGLVLSYALSITMLTSMTVTPHCNHRICWGI